MSKKMKLSKKTVKDFNKLVETLIKRANEELAEKSIYQSLTTLDSLSSVANWFNHGKSCCCKEGLSSNRSTGIVQGKS